MDSLLRAIFPFLVPGLLSLSGCAGPPAVDPAEVAKLQQRLTLTEEPDGVQTVSEVRMAMLGEAPPDVLALIEPEGGHATHVDAGEEGGEEHAEAEHEHAAGAEHAEHAEAEAEHAEAEHAAAEHADHEAGEEAAAHADKEPAERPESMKVAIVGVVGGVPNPSVQTFAEFPFAKGQAMFFLADPEAVATLEEHGHHHAPGEECSFCAAHAADASTLIAAVTFADEQGKPYAVDARELFDLKAGETVVVQGVAKAAPGGVLTVEATGLYVRR